MKGNDNMNEIKVFENAEFGRVRTVIIDNVPWFVARDIATALGYVKPENAVAAHVQTDDKTTTLIQGTGSNYKSKTVIVNESGMYALIFGSKLENAQRFKRWVTSEVLPDIRQHGMYMTGEKLVDMMADPDKALEMLIDYAKERKERLRLEQVVKEQQPKVEFADAVNSSKNGILVKQMANLLARNGYSTGQNRLFEQLRKDGFICSTKGERFNTPTQKAIDMGLMITKESHYDSGDGVTLLSFTPLITPRGQRYFLGKYANALLTDEEINDMLKEIV